MESHVARQAGRSTPPSAVERWFYRSAGVDLDIVGQLPYSERAYYVSMGVLVTLVAALAGIGAASQLSLHLGSGAIPLVGALALAAIWAAIVFSTERTLITSIPVEAHPLRKCAAVAGRAVFAAVSAMAVSLPLLLSIFSGQISDFNEEQRLTALTQRVHLTNRAAGVGDAERVRDAAAAALATESARASQLPAAVTEIKSAHADCTRVYQRMQRERGPLIRGLELERELIQVNLRNEGIASVEVAARESRLRDVDQQLERHKRVLQEQRMECGRLWRSYTTGLSALVQDQAEREGVARNRLTQMEQQVSEARDRASAELAGSEQSLKAATGPALGSRLAAFLHLVREDNGVGAWTAVIYFLIFVVEMLPVLTKVLGSRIAERLMAARRAREFAAIDAETSSVVLEAKLQAQLAEELFGAKRAGLTTAIAATVDGSLKRSMYAHDAAVIGGLTHQVRDAYRQAAGSETEIERTGHGAAVISSFRQSLAEASIRATSVEHGAKGAGPGHRNGDARVETRGDAPAATGKTRSPR